MGKRMIISRLIEKYSKDAEYRIKKINNLQTNEEDLILLLRDFNEIIKIIDNLRNKLSNSFSKFITKN